MEKESFVTWYAVFIVCSWFPDRPCKLITTVCMHIYSLCAGLGNYCPGGVNLVIGDMPPILFGAHPPGFAEFHSKRQLLSQLTCACKVCTCVGEVCTCTHVLACKVCTHLICNMCMSNGWHVLTRWFTFFWCKITSNGMPEQTWWGYWRFWHNCCLHRHSLIKHSKNIKICVCVCLSLIFTYIHVSDSLPRWDLCVSGVWVVDPFQCWSGLPHVQTLWRCEDAQCVPQLLNIIQDVIYY